jgi:class 3 adenylate cyclase/tetratricopeptide (TPR) repeat protein
MTLKNDRDIFMEAGRPRAHTVERRQLTALFCDLVNSTSLFSTLDPEDVRDILHSYASICATRIEAAGGIFAQFQGDAVLGYFGYIDGSENGAEQAVRAALDLTQAVTRMKVAEDRQLHVRIGVATGLAIIGEPNARAIVPEQSVVGEAVHVASRLQTMASANEIVIADSTKEITGNLFVCQDLGDLVLKGVFRPIRAWKVLRARRAISQFRMRRTPVLTEFVGRELEMRALQQGWGSVKNGEGRCIYVIGEAGIGKSRLVNAFRHTIRADRHIWLEGGGAQHSSNTPFAPISRMVKQVLDPFGRAGTAELNRRLTSALAAMGREFAEASLEIGEVLGWQSSTASAPTSIVSAEKRHRAFSILRRWLCVTARSRPVIVVLEDLHWFDPSSLDLLQKIIEEIHSFPILIICTMRPASRLLSLIEGHSDIIRLSPMTAADLWRIVRHLGGPDALPEERIAAAIRRAGGVPLFAIELARLIVEQRGRTEPRHIPSTLSGLLQSRLDGLGSAKRVAQTAAVIGDEVHRVILEALSDGTKDDFDAQLATLIRQGLFRENRSANGVTYGFTHALLRDAAYETLAKSERRQLHHKSATAIAVAMPAIALSHPEILAHHWTSAEEWQEAVAAWQRAGDLAQTRRGFAEAEQAYENAIAALMKLPPSSMRDAHELMLQSLLADTVRIIHGFSAPKTINVTERARKLAERNRDRGQQFLQMWGAWTAASSDGDHPMAVELADGFYRLAVADGGIVNLAHAHMMQMTSLYRIGDLTKAEHIFTEGERFFTSSEFERRPGVVAQTYGNAARIAWILGDCGKARQRIDHTLAVSYKYNNPYSMVYAQYMSAIHSILTKELNAAVEHASNAISICEKYRFQQFLASSRIALGRALVDVSQPSEGLEYICDGLSGMSSTPIRVAMTMYMTWLAEAYLRIGDLDKALQAANDALQTNRHEKFFRPEIMRVRGEILLRMGCADAAEQSFIAALSLATQMRAERFRCRANKSLHRALNMRQSGLP